jgi:hypothetical protein
VLRRGARFSALTCTVEGSGRLMVSVVPLTPQRVGAHIRRILRKRG